MKRTLLSYFASIVMATPVFAEVTPAIPKFSEGYPIVLKDAGFEITPTQGWQISTDRGPSLVLEEPEKSVKNIRIKDAKGKNIITRFRRYITVAKKNVPAPMDEMTIKTLTADLMEQFGGNGLITNYNVTQTEFFDYRDDKKALLAYAHYYMGDVAMMHMHVLLSSDDKQYLATYSDFAKRLQQNDKTFDKAWQMINSIEYEGHPPVRFEQTKLYATVIGFLLGLFIFFRIIARIRSQRRLNSFMREEEMGDAEDHQSLVWGEDSMPATALKPGRRRKKKSGKPSRLPVHIAEDDDFGFGDNEDDEEFDYDINDSRFDSMHPTW